MTAHPWLACSCNQSRAWDGGPTTAAHDPTLFAGVLEKSSRLFQSWQALHDEAVVSSFADLTARLTQQFPAPAPRFTLVVGGPRASAEVPPPQVVMRPLQSTTAAAVAPVPPATLIVVRGHYILVLGVSTAVAAPWQQPKPRHPLLRGRQSGA